MDILKSWAHVEASRRTSGVVRQVDMKDRKAESCRRHSTATSDGLPEKERTTIGTLQPSLDYYCLIFIVNFLQDAPESEHIQNDNAKKFASHHGSGIMSVLDT